MPQELIDLTGQIFGRLKVLEHFKIVDRSGKRVRTKWRCKCECGNITDVAGSSLRSGNTKSCMTRTTIRVKLKKGQSAEEILSHPVRKIKKR